MFIWKQHKMMRTANPALHGETFKVTGTGEVMTLSGTVNKTGLLRLLTGRGMFMVTTWRLGTAMLRD